MCTSCPVVPFDNNGCNGGDTYYAFEYIIANGGVDTASYYPYKARVSVAITGRLCKCQCQCNLILQQYEQGKNHKKCTETYKDIGKGGSVNT